MKLKIRAAGILLLYFCMFGCSSIAIDTDPGKPIQFVDLPIFDQQVERALQAKPEQVTIALLDKVKPSQIPDRLRLWITSAQKAGANVDIELPAGEIQPRGIPLLSLIPSLLSFIKFSDAARSPSERPAAAHSAVSGEIGRAHV